MAVRRISPWGYLLARHPLLGPEARRPGYIQKSDSRNSQGEMVLFQSLSVVYYKFIVSTDVSDHFGRYVRKYLHKFQQSSTLCKIIFHFQLESSDGIQLFARFLA